MGRREAKQEAEAGAEVKRGKKETEDGNWELGGGGGNTSLPHPQSPDIQANS